MALTIGGLITEARGVLNDTVGTPALRYTDADLVSYLNDALIHVRAKRPDAWLSVLANMQTPITLYAMPGDSNTVFPLDQRFYPPVVSYVIGFAELREDTFADDARAVAMLNKFTTQLMQSAG